MNKFLVYTSNPEVMPKGMDDVLKFADSKHKYLFARVKSGSGLAKVGVGDHIISGKGNNIYVTHVLETTSDDLSRADSAIVDDLKRKGLKRMNIKEVSQIIPFECWCKTAKAVDRTLSGCSGASKSNNKSTKTMSNSFKGISSRLREMFMPTEVENIRIAQDGNVCVETKKGWVAINAAGELCAYPDELTISSIPAFVASKPVSQLQAGDIIALDDSYAKVKSYDAATGKIKAVSYTGSGKTIFPVKDVIFNQSLVRVVVSLASNLGFNAGNGGINPMMLMMLKDKGGKSSSMKDLLMLQALGGNAGAAGNGGFNPMMLAFMDEDGDSSMKDILMMQALAGNGGANLFGGLFGGAAQAAPAPAAPAAE